MLDDSSRHRHVHERHASLTLDKELCNFTQGAAYLINTQTRADSLIFGPSFSCPSFGENCSL